MPKSLEKTRKAIAKKKGSIGSLHENSRGTAFDLYVLTVALTVFADSQRLRRAGMRDEKLAKVSAARKKQEQPLSTMHSYIYVRDYAEKHIS
jgi:translation machinery-associated protein 16